MSDKKTTFVPGRVATAAGLAALALIAAPILSQASSGSAALVGAICVVVLVQARARRATASAAQVLRCARIGCLVHQEGTGK